MSPIITIDVSLVWEIIWGLFTFLQLIHVLYYVYRYCRPAAAAATPAAPPANAVQRVNYGGRQRACTNRVRRRRDLQAAHREQLVLQQAREDQHPPPYPGRYQGPRRPRQPLPAVIPSLRIQVPRGQPAPIIFEEEEDIVNVGSEEEDSGNDDRHHEH